MSLVRPGPLRRLGPQATRDDVFNRKDWGNSGWAIYIVPQTSRYLLSCREKNLDCVLRLSNVMGV